MCNCTNDDCGQWLLISYECLCGAEWSDEWSSACDGECPECGRTIEAKSWETIKKRGAQR